MQFLQLLIAGVSQGCIYGLIALGFVLIYKATETVSFAQGDLMMLGAFAALALMTLLGFPFWLAVPSAIGAMALVGDRPSTADWIGFAGVLAGAALILLPARGATTR